MQDNKLPKKILRVALIVPGWPVGTFPNGIVTYTHNILRGFGDKAKLIILATPLVGAEIKDELINLSKFLTSKKSFYKMVVKLADKFTSQEASVIQYQRLIKDSAKKINLGLKSLSTPVDILEIEESFGTPHYVRKMTKVPIVTRLHGPWFMHGPIMKMDNDPNYHLRVFYEGEAIKNSHGLTSPSLDILEKTRQYYGIDLPFARVLPNPVCEVSIEKRWQFNNAKKSILVVGRFDLHKGGDIALEAFRIIALENTEVDLLFVGPDKGVTIADKNFSFDEYIERFIPEDSIKNRIQFLGHCDQERISNLRKNALVTIVCSRYETFSIALIESLAAGCPTVATAVGGMKEIIIDEYNGLLAESESPENIAQKVLMLINDPEKMQRLSKNAIEDCKKRFSPEVVAAQTLEYYQSVLDRVSDASTNN